MSITYQPTLEWLAAQYDALLVEIWFHAGRINHEDRQYWLDLLPKLRASRPEEPFPSDREQAALWRDLALLDPMDLMVIYGGAENDVVLLGKLKEFIEAKRREPQSERE